MNWTVLAIGDTGTVDMEHLCSVACVGSATYVSGGSIEWAIAEASTDGIIVVGRDHHLAAVAAAMVAGDHRQPLLHVPSAPSDLQRMFGDHGGDVLLKLRTGTAYATDLGIVDIGGSAHAFVGHVVASPRSLIGRLLRPAAKIGILAPGRSYTPPATAVMAFNCQHRGTSTIAPKAAVNDGLLDIQAWTGRGRHRWRVARLARRGLHLRDPAVWRRQLPAGRVEVPPGWAVDTDGIRTGYGSFELRLVPRAFELWI